jgi:multidrug efflux pump subunit AcrB
MVMATLFFFGSIALIPLLPTGFIPPDDNSQTQVYLELPPGSTLAQTLASAEQARDMMAARWSTSRACTPPLAAAARAATRLP